MGRLVKAVVHLLPILALLSSCAKETPKTNTEWPMYFGRPDASKYSNLDQINVDNVGDLEVAWKWTASDAGGNTTIQCNPLQIGNTLYIISPGLSLVALNAITGTETWIYSPSGSPARGGNSRGVTYWADDAQQRIFYGTGRELHALDAQTGYLDSTFADQGKLDLGTGLGLDQSTGWVTLTTPGVIFNDLLILGSRVGEGPGPAAPGHIRAFDARTGELVWIFRTIPRPQDSEAATWSVEHLSNMGGANSWGGFALDEKRGWVIFGTGSASYDHWGGNRIGQNLYANCLIALNASTGEKIWHQQLVHHDIWDYDIPCPPNLVQVKIDGNLVDAVAQPTKMGHLFVFDREDGHPIFPISEEPVPASLIPGEQTWKTQPYPIYSLRYGIQGLGPDELNELTPKMFEEAKAAIEGIALGRLFDPPSEDGVIAMPQFNGGTDWGGAAYNPTNRVLFVNCSNVAEWISMVQNQAGEDLSTHQLGQLIFRSSCQSCHNTAHGNAPALPHLAESLILNERNFSKIIKEGRSLMPAFAHLTDAELSAIKAFVSDSGKDQKLTQDQLLASRQLLVPWVATGHNEVATHDGYPINAPPWGTLTAIDLDKGEQIWQSPLGTYPRLEAQGHPPTGTFNMGGPIATAGGLIFIGATMDERFRAFDQETGDVVWEFQLDAGAYSTPSTYAIDGRQYVVVGAGGGGKPGTKSGSSYYCFTLRY